MTQNEFDQRVQDEINRRIRAQEKLNEAARVVAIQERGWDIGREYGCYWVAENKRLGVEDEGALTAVTYAAILGAIEDYEDERAEDERLERKRLEDAAAFLGHSIVRGEG